VFDGTDDIDPYDSLDDIDQTPTWSKRLGIDQIDPLITRTSVIILAALVAVPFAWTNREDAPASAPAATVVFENASGTTDEPTVPTVGADTTEAPAVTASPVVIAAPASSVATTVAAPSAHSRAAGTRSQVLTAPTTTTPPCGSTYVVRAGDSWSLVADRASIRMSELLATNSASTDSMLYPDDEICLPPGATVVIPTTVPKRSGSSNTAPAPAITTTTTIVLPPEPSTSEAEAIIREVWPDDLEDRALEIARRESRFHANASNWCCVGLFQLHWNAHKGWLSAIGVTSKAQLFDARTNAQAAYALYQRSGWAPWNL
jgi:LysM repeat protein